MPELYVERLRRMVAVKSPAGGPPLDWGVGHYERTAQMLLPAAHVLVAAAALRAGDRVLDLGSGTGNAALLAAAAGAHVTAVDPSRRLLDVARVAAQERDLNITFEVGDAANLPSPEQSVDCVLSNFGLIFASEPAAAAGEIARVLDSGGRAVLTAWLPGGAIGALAAATQDLIRTATGAPPASPGFPWHDEAAVNDLFARHGMTAAVAARDEVVFAAPSPHAYLDAEADSHPLAVAAIKVLHRLGQTDQARDRLLKVLIDHNEEANSFRSTSHYVVVIVRQADV